MMPQRSRISEPTDPRKPRTGLADEASHLALLFQERVARYGDKTALRYERDGRWYGLSWKSFGEHIHSLARGLLELGVKEGERIGIYSSNRPEWTIADLATMRIRAATVPIDPTSTAEQAEYIIDDARIRVLFVNGPEQYERARSLVIEHQRRLKLIIFDPAVAPVPNDGSLYFHELLEIGRNSAGDDEVTRRLEQARPDDLATLIYTSGTTGAPKGVMLDHANLVGALPPHDLRLPDPDENDSSLSILPLSNVFERLWTFYVLSRGMTNHYLDDPSKVIEAVQQVSPTLMCAAPRFYEKMYATVKKRSESASPAERRLFQWALDVGAEEARLRRRALPVPMRLRLERSVADALVLRKIRALVGGRIKFFVCAGAPLSREIEELFDAAGLFIYQGYGLTETSGGIVAATWACTGPVSFVQQRQAPRLSPR